jgi:surface antigen
MGNAGYSAHNSTMYWRMYSGHNCVNYAAYRMVASGMPNVRPWSGGGNATFWGTSNPSLTDQTPRVGAVAWWRAYSSPAGSAGHVGYVEQVVSPTEIIVSMDWWGGDFTWARITKSGGSWPSGFIHFNDRKIASTAAPVVTGTPQIGATLTSSAATFSPAPDAVAYQWRANGVDIAGATGQSLALAPAQLGKRITVRATATKAAYPTASSTSQQTPAVAPGVLASTAAPVIQGATRVGATLSATAATWTPAGASVSYQWRADGVDLAGATGQSLLLRPAQQGQRITVRATAVEPGYTTDSSTSAATAPVDPDVLTNTAAPSVVGTPVVEQVLTADPGTWLPTPAHLHYQWLANGRAVTGATAPTLDTTPELVGKTVSVRVTARKWGYDPVRANAAPTSVIAPGTFTATSTPTITGTALLGRELTLAPGSWTPTGDVAVQWLRNGVPVPHATGTTYSLTASDVAARMSATTTITRPGYTMATASAVPTTAVQSTASVTAAVRRGSHRTFLDVGVSAAGVSSVTGEVMVLRRGVVIGQGSLRRGVVHVPVPEVPAGSRLFRIRYDGSPTVPARVVRCRLLVP